MALGDVDLDGRSDLLLADLGCSDPACTPRLWLISGATGRTLYRVDLPLRDEHQEIRTLRLGDLDGDRISEWAVLESSENGADRELVFDGRSGALVRDALVPGLQEPARFVAVLGDLDGDGAPEALVAATSAKVERSFSIHSLRDGRTLANWDLEWTGMSKLHCAAGLPERGIALLLISTEVDPTPELCAVDWRSGALVFALELTESRYKTYGVCSIPDLDGDGAEDFACTFNFRVELRSSKNGSLLATPKGGPDAGDFGRTIVGLRALDGRVRIAISAEDSGVAQGTVYVFDPAERTDCTVESDPDAWHFGAVLAEAGDQDGDGVPDLLISGDHSESHEPSYVWVYSAYTGQPIDVLARWRRSVFRRPAWRLRWAESTRP